MNEVFALIIKAELNPSEFSWEEHESEFGYHKVARLRHNPSEFFFSFETKRDGKHYAIYSPGAEASTERAFPGTWSIQLQYCARWIEYLKREIQAPNLWEELAKGDAWESLSEGDGNEPFSKVEVESIRTELLRLNGEIRGKFDLTEAQFGYIKRQLDYLATSAERVGRKDWLMFASGALFNIAYDIAKTSPHTTELINFLARAIFQVSHHLPAIARQTLLP